MIQPIRFLLLFVFYFLGQNFIATAQDVVIPQSQSVFTAYSGNGWFYIADSVFLSPDSLLKLLPTEFGLSNSDSIALYNDRCDSNLCHNTYVQYHKGYPISNYFFAIHAKSDTVRLLNGTVLGNLDLDTIVNVSADSAINIAISFLSDSSLTFAWQATSFENTSKRILDDSSFTYYPDSTVLVYHKTEEQYDQNDSILIPSETILCHSVDIVTTSPLTEHTILVNAFNGEVVDSFSFSPSYASSCSTGTCDVWYHGSQSIFTTHNAGSFQLVENCNGRKIRTTYDGNAIINPSNSWSAGPDDYDMKGSLHWCSEQVYDYFKNRLGISSYDDNNTEMVANLNPNQCSAWWVPAGNNSYVDIGVDVNSCIGCIPKEVPIELFIVGHEYAHGIVQTFNPWLDDAQKGTITEAFCDIIGGLAYEYSTGISNYYQETTNTFDFNSGLACHRPWDNPGNSSQQMPDTYKGLYYSCTKGMPDAQYNKYINTSLLTHWFYLLAEGGNGTNDHGTSYTISEIGVIKAEKILFIAITGGYYASTSNNSLDFHDLRKATIEAAYDYYGKSVAETVYEAWRAVGVYTSDDGFNSLNPSLTIEDKIVLDYPFDSRHSGIIIAGGGELVVESYLNLAENSLFIVEPGGKLTVNGGHIRCDNMDIDFEDDYYDEPGNPKPVRRYVCIPFNGATQGYFSGIEILGNPEQAQNESNQGVLRATNTIIEGAINTLIAVGNPASNTLGGGIIEAINTTFKNGEVIVDFKPYQGSHPTLNLSIKNKSVFHNCDFIVDQPREKYYLSAKQPHSLVRMNGVDGIIFNGCTFKTDENLDLGWVQMGVGILSINSGFTVQDHCPGTQLPCEEETISSEFNNLFIGVNALEYATPPSPITIKNATFDRALRAIELDGVNGPLIAENTFRNYAHGVYLHGCSDFRVRENTFEYDDFGTRAVSSTASELPGSEVGYNTFLSGVSPGITFSYLNSDVQLKCNDFSNHTALDILLGSRTFTDQGECISGQGANNRFNATDDNTHIHINPQVSEPDGRIFYRYFRKTGELREPQNIYNGSNTSFFTTDCGDAGTEDQCNPSSTSTGGGFELFFGLKGYVDSLEQLLDGGQRDELTALVQNDQVSDQALADSFSAFDSLLSNATLLRVISQRPDIADSLLFPALTRNQPLSPIIYRALQYHQTLTDALYDSLLTLEDTVMTYRKQIIHSIDSANVLMNRLYRDIAYTYRKNDSIHFLAAFLDTSGLDPVDRAVRKLPLMLGLGYTDSVTQVLTDPVFDYTYELNTLKTVYQNILDAQDAYLDADSTIDTTYVPIFKALHNTSEARAGAIAEAFNGGFMGDSLYAEYYEEPVTGKRNMQEKPDPETVTANRENSPLIVPNPNDGSFTIITPGEDGSNLPYQIIDFSGRTIQTGRLTEGSTAVAVNQPGFYVLIIDNGNGSSYEKFVVQ